MSVTKGFQNSLSSAKGYLASPKDTPPTLSLTAKDLGDIKGWKIGQTYDLSVSAKLVSLSNDSYSDGLQARLEIQSVEPCDDSENGDDN